MATPLTLPATLTTIINAVVLTTCPNSTQILQTLNGLSLYSFSNEIKTTAYNVSARIGTTIIDSGNSVIIDLKTQLGSVNKTLADSVSPHIDTLNGDADKYSQMINDSFSNVIFKFDNYR